MDYNFCLQVGFQATAWVSVGSQIGDEVVVRVEEADPRDDSLSLKEVVQVTWRYSSSSQDLKFMIYIPQKRHLGLFLTMVSRVKNYNVLLAVVKWHVPFITLN